MSLLHVAMQMGPSLHPDRLDVRRMASEDSDPEDQSFLLIFCTGRIVTRLPWEARTAGYPRLSSI